MLRCSQVFLSRRVKWLGELNVWRVHWSGGEIKHGTYTLPALYFESLSSSEDKTWQVLAENGQKTKELFGACFVHVEAKPSVPDEMQMIIIITLYVYAFVHPIFSSYSVYLHFHWKHFNWNIKNRLLLRFGSYSAVKHEVCSFSPLEFDGLILA